MRAARHGVRGRIDAIRQRILQQPTYLWEDELGAVHEIQQGEGGELPMLFSLGQHPAWWRSQANEKLFAFLEDICVVCTPGLRRRSGPVDSEV